MSRYYLGNWVSDGEGGFQPPAGVVGCIDLAPVPVQGESASDRPVGLFTTGGATLPSEYALLGVGDCRELSVTAEMRSAVQSLVGVQANGEKLVDLIYDLLTNGSDPDGEAGPKPLIPTAIGFCELHLGGHSLVLSQRFTWGNGHWQKVKQMLRKEFAQHFDHAKNGKLKDAEHHRRVLDFWCEKYKLTGSDDWKEFVPANLQRDVPGRLKHETTITDDFNRADAANPPSNAAAGWSWTQINSQCQVKNNHLSDNVAGSSTEVRADSDLSSEDHYSQVLISAGGAINTGTGCGCRKDGTSTRTFYRTDVNGANVQRLFKRVSGTGTTLRTDAPTFSVPATVKVDSSGSTISHYVGGVSTGSSTDTAITGNLRCMAIPGFGSGDTNQLDDFQAADLAAAATAVPVFMNQYRQRWN